MFTLYGNSTKCYYFKINDVLPIICVAMYRSFMDNELEMEFALPSTIDEEAIECSIQLAEEMGKLFEKGGRVSCLTCMNKALK